MKFKCRQLHKRWQSIRAVTPDDAAVEYAMAKLDPNEVGEETEVYVRDIGTYALLWDGIEWIEIGFAPIRNDWYQSALEHPDRGE